MVLQINHTVTFQKFSGAGNDFVIIDNRKAEVPQAEYSALARAICRRKLSVGADGLILIENSDQVDFKWAFFNADGSEADMCGNGARCAARFAFLNGMAPAQMHFETGAGIIEAHIQGDQVRIGLTPPHAIQKELFLTLEDQTIAAGSINTGVPHLVVEVSDLETVDVFRTGRALRYHSHFAPQGTNVNFAQLLPDRTVSIRTYERGVEDETMACGTGSTAAALLFHCIHGLTSPVTIHTRSNCQLKIYFTPTGNDFEQVCLEGEARQIYQGILNSEAWTDINAMCNFSQL